MTKQGLQVLSKLTESYEKGQESQRQLQQEKLQFEKWKSLAKAAKPIMLVGTSKRTKGKKRNSGKDKILQILHVKKIVLSHNWSLILLHDWWIVLYPRKRT